MIRGASTDIQPGNFLFALNRPRDEPDLDDHTSPELSPTIYPLQRVDGKPLDAHSPTYIVRPQPLESNFVDTSLLSASRLVLSDFGAGMLSIPIKYIFKLTDKAATFEESNDGCYAYPVSFIPPEVLLGLPVSEKSDIWALGCTVSGRFHAYI